MNDIQAIQKRISRRSFLQQKVSEEKIQKLQTMATQLNKESGLTFEILLEGSSMFSDLSKSYGMFKNVQSLILLKGPMDNISVEKSGYYGEKLVLELTKLGLGSCWVHGTYDKNNPMLQGQGDNRLICVIPFGEVTAQTTTKEKMIRGISHRRTKTAKEMTNAGKEAPNWFWNAMEAVQLAPSALNSQKTKILLQEGKIIAQIGAVKETDFIDLGIAKLHFEIGADNGKRFQWGDGGEFI